MEKKKRQFRGASKPKDFYDRKVIKGIGTRQISITPIIPEDWKYVRLWKAEEHPNMIVLIIEKLVGGPAIAPTTTVDTKRE